jgi:hypothetical protein
MRFTVEPEPLIGIVAMVGERAPWRRNAAGDVRLSASAGQVCIESNAAVAVTDAAVSEDGQCSVSRAKLLAALKAYRGESRITLKADDLGLRMGNVSVPVTHYASRATAPAAYQIFLATESGVVSSKPAAPF